MESGQSTATGNNAATGSSRKLQKEEGSRQPSAMGPPLLARTSGRETRVGPLRCRHVCPKLDLQPLRYLLARDPGPIHYALLFAHQHLLARRIFLSPARNSLPATPETARLFPHLFSQIACCTACPTTRLALQPHIRAATHPEIYDPTWTAVPPYTSLTLLSRVRVGTGRYGSNSLRACS